MTNLEKLTAGEIAAENNGTLEQLREVVGHSFPKSDTPQGCSKFYFKDKLIEKYLWNDAQTTTLPTIDITQLWEELQSLKKPEIWWIRVTEENKETLEKWYGYGNLIPNYHLIGMVKRLGKITKSCNSKGISKGETYDFGNEIDFPTFLKYTGVEPEKVEKSLAGKQNEVDELESKINIIASLILDRNKLVELHNRTGEELKELDTKISALLK